MIYEVPMWKAKLGCPMCGKIEKKDFGEKDEWFISEHLKEHSHSEISDCLTDGMIRVMEGLPGWKLKEIT